MSVERDIKDIIVAFWYNRNDNEIRSLCEEIKNRVAKCPCEHTDDGDLLYSIIIMMVGEYGTSPRSGWLLNIKPERLIKIITDFEDMYMGE